MYNSTFKIVITNKIQVKISSIYNKMCTWAVLSAFIKQCDGMWQEWFPVSVPSTAELKQPVWEGAPLSDHGVMERVLIFIHNGQQLI